MKRAAFLLIFMFLLFACATEAQYNQKLEKYVGRTQANLIENFGQPSAKKIMPDGTEVLTYTKISESYVPIEYFYDNPGWGETDIVYNPFWGEYELAPFSSIVDTEVEEICQTSFVVKNNIVVSYKFRGNNCF